MATAYSTSLRLALPVTGELNGTWGDVVNQQITSMVEQGLAGFVSVAITGNHTLTTANGSSDQARNMVVQLTGTLSANANITVPTASKLYFIDNATTGGYAVVVKTSAGTGVTVPNGRKRVVYCDGTNVVDAVSDLPSGAMVNGVEIVTLSGTQTLTNKTLTSPSISSPTISDGTANGVLYLNGSKAVTSGSALTFDGTKLAIGGRLGFSSLSSDPDDFGVWVSNATGAMTIAAQSTNPIAFRINGTEQMRLTSTGLGIGTTSVSGYWGSGAGTTARQVIAYSSATTTFDTAAKGLVIQNTDQTAGNFSSLVFATNNSTPSSVATAAIYSVNKDARVVGFTTGDLAFATVGGSGVLSERMRLDASGNLGLGVPPSGWATVVPAFQIGGAGGYIAAQGTAEVLRIGSNNYYNAGWKYVVNGYASRYDQASGTHAWFTAPSGTAGNPISFTQAMTLSATGNLGIGTTTSSNFRTFVYHNASVGSDSAAFVVRQDGSDPIAIFQAFGGIERARIDSSGNLGIGTSSPTGGRLHVVQTTGSAIFGTTAGGTGYGGNFENTDGGTTKFVRAAGAGGNGVFAAGVGATTQLLLDTSGNLGLGVTPSGWDSAYRALQIGYSTALWGATGSNFVSLSNNTYYDTDFKYKNDGYASRYALNSEGKHLWYTAPSGTAGNAISFTQAMTLDASGNLGIGATGNLSKLTVGTGNNHAGLSAFNTANANISGIVISNWTGSATTQGPRMLFDNSGFGDWYVGSSNGANNFDICASWGTPMLRVDANGNLLVGTTSVYGSSKLSVNGDVVIANGNGYSWGSNSSSYTGLVGSNATNYIAAYTNNTERARIDSSGNFILTSNKSLINYGGGGVTSNSSIGSNALANNTTGYNNTANGVSALYSNTTGYANTANGQYALLYNTTGVQNTANGQAALQNNTTGNYNTANGRAALQDNTTGYYNTANGRAALQNNTTGVSNTANGVAALLFNTTGYNNTADGVNALLYNNTGYNNTANGQTALYSNTTGYYNTANGVGALYNNTTGNYNTANGHTALYSNTTGNYNTANGYTALYNNTTGASNTALGSQYTTAGTYAPAFDCTTENNRVSIAHTGVTNAYINVAWTVVSDERDKTNFGQVPHGIEFVKQLNPISYQRKVSREDATPDGPVRYGFKAQDVLALEGDMPVIVDNEDPDRLRLIDSNLLAVLVKAVQEQQAQIEQLKSEINQLKGA